MVWAKNGTPDTLGSAGDVMAITDMTANKFNQFMTHQLQSGVIDGSLRFNADSGSLYSIRASNNGGADATAGSQNRIGHNNSQAASEDGFIVDYMCAIVGEEKLLIGFQMAGNTAGAGNAPERTEVVGKYVPSPLSDTITQVSDTNIGGGDFAISSNLSALGTD